MGGPILRRGNDVAMFSTSRLLQHGPFPREDLQLTALLIPHLRRACLLHQRLARLRADRAGALAALELLPQAVWLLDGHGCLLLANRAGRELDRQHDGLWLGPEGHPRATNMTERQALERCISGAIGAGRSRTLDAHGGVAVHRPSDGGTLYVVAYPLAADALLQGAAVALFVSDPQRPRVADGDALRVIYGLTPAESRLSAALAQGSTVEAYCEMHGLALSTGRTHLRQALAKTGLNRQSQLVALLAQMTLGRQADERR
jgi:DNA-binding CsgD family transcriptional regulator